MCKKIVTTNIALSSLWEIDVYKVKHHKHAQYFIIGNINLANFLVKKLETCRVFCKGVCSSKDQ